MRRVPAAAALILIAAANVGSQAVLAAPSHIPAPITRIQPAHRLVALTLQSEGGFHGWAGLGAELHRSGAQATVFVTAQQIRQDRESLRRLLQAGDVEVGLTTEERSGHGKGDATDLVAAGDEAERLLGERVGVYQPRSAAEAVQAARDAYAAGLVTMLWSRSAGSDVQALAGLARQVRAGEIVRFDLRAGQAVARIEPALRSLRQRGLLFTTASGLLEDAAQHLEYCGRHEPAAAHVARQGGRARLGALYPAAGPAARALWHLGRPGEFSVRRLYGVKTGVRLAGRPIGGYLPGEVTAAVRQEARRRYVAPVAATLSHPDGQVVPDRSGRRLDLGATSRRIWQARRGDDVRPVIRVVHARWRTEDIAALTTVIGQYRTWIDGSSGRYMNIQKGAGRINNRIVFPGETFSTLDAIGDVTKQPGWHRAPVIVWGGYTEGVGGGLCQVSSTLYNAVRKADLKIVERHHHAKAVHYVPHGRDATIAWPDLDFRFSNNRATPVVVKAYVRGGALFTIIMGRSAAGEAAARTMAAADRP